MSAVHLRPITRDSLAECLRLSVDDSQTSLVSNNAKSLAEAYVNPNLHPLAIYPVAALGHETQLLVPMVGFCMYELAAGVGFILRLMVGRQYQGKGYGRAAMLEVIRRLRLHPEVEMIATSHKHANEVAANVYRSLGFVPWEIEWAERDESEKYLRLP